MSKKIKKAHGFFAEFRKFISKGSVIDLAVGVIIGGAFTAIVTALTNQILNPLINWLISLVGGKKALESCRTILGTAVYKTGADGTQVIDWANTIYIDWGAFISAVINFFLVAFILFLIVKGINKAKEKETELKAKALEEYYKAHPEERPVPPAPGIPEPSDHDILKDILEELKKNNTK